MWGESWRIFVLGGGSALAAALLCAQGALGSGLELCRLHFTAFAVARQRPIAWRGGYGLDILDTLSYDGAVAKRTQAEKRRLFLDALSRGASVSEAAAYSGVVRATVYGWADKDLAFQQQWHVAEAQA